MAESINGDGERLEDRIVLKVACQHCGEVAEMRMTPEVALRTATGLQAAAAGLEPLEIDVRGQG